MKIRWLGVYTAFFLLFLYAPIIILPLFAFNDSSVIAFPLTGFTLQWFTQLLEVKSLHDATWNSLRIALITSLFCTILGILTVRATSRYSFPLKRPVMGMIMLPLVLPEIIVGVSLLVVILKVLNLNLSHWTVIAGHTLLFTPFSIAILNSSFQNLDLSLEEAAIDLGETPWGAFRRVILPLVTPGLVSSLLVAFSCSLDEFIVAFFLTGSQPTLPVYIFGQFRFPAKVPVVMALGTILVALSITMLMVAEYFRRRGLARSGKQDTGGFL